MNNKSFETLKNRIDESTYEQLEILISNINSKLEIKTLDKIEIEYYNKALKIANEKFDESREEKANSLFNELDGEIANIKKQSKGIKTYDETKKEFEENHFKIQAPFGYFIKKYNKHTDLEALGGLVKEYAIEKQYRNLYYADKELNKKTGTYEIKKDKFIKKWLDDENIKNYRTLTFAPKCKVDEDTYNVFEGYKASFLQSDKITLDDLKQSKIYNHYKHIICNGDEKRLNYLLMFMSRIVKNPSNLTRVCIIFKSKEGAGKDIGWDYLGNNIIGRRYYINTDKQEVLVGKFNSLINNKVLAIFAEANADIHNNKDLIEGIKNQMTNPTITIENKGKDAYTSYNCCNIGATTNRDTSFPFSIGERRFNIFDVNNKYCEENLRIHPELRPEAETYFNELIEEIKSNKYDKAFYDLLMSLDSDKFNFQNERVDSQSYNDCKLLSAPKSVQFLISRLENKSLNNSYKASILYEIYKEWLTTNGIDKKPNAAAFSVELLKNIGITKRRTSECVYYDIDIDQLKKYYVSMGLFETIEFIE